MSRSLTNTYEWQPRVLVSVLLTALVIAWLVVSHSPATVPMAGGLAVVLAFYLGEVWLRARGAATFTDDGSLVARHWFTTRTIRPGEVIKVKEIINGRSPDVKLVTTKGSIVVPCSKLHAGHSALFSWLAETQPQAAYDKGAERLRVRLDAGGYLDGSRDPRIDETWGIRKMDPSALIPQLIPLSSLPKEPTSRDLAARYGYQASHTDDGSTTASGQKNMDIYGNQKRR